MFRWLYFADFETIMFVFLVFFWLSSMVPKFQSITWLANEKVSFVCSFTLRQYFYLNTIDLFLAAGPQSAYILLVVFGPFGSQKTLRRWFFGLKPSFLLKLFLICFLYLNLHLSLFHSPEKNSVLE